VAVGRNVGALVETKAPAVVMMTWLTEAQRPVRRDNSGLAHSNIQTGEYGGRFRLSAL